MLHSSASMAYDKKLLAISLLIFAWGGLSEHSSHLFIQKGLMAGITSYGHLTYDINLHDIDATLHFAYETLEKLKTYKDGVKDEEARRRLRTYYNAFKRQLRQMSKEWSNMKMIFIPERANDSSIIHLSRPPRFIATSIALVAGITSTMMGIFNTAALSSLSDNIDNEEHLVEVLQEHETRITLIEEDVLRLNKTTNKIYLHLSQTASLERIDALAIHLESYLSLVQAQIFRFNQGLEALLHHRASPAFLHSDQLYPALERLSERAKAQGYLFSTEQMEAGIYMLDTSFLVLDDDRLRIFIHLPLLRSGSILELYQLLPLPINVNGTDRQLQIAGIDYLIGVNEDQDYYTLFPYTDLAECDFLGHVYFCEHHNILRRDFGETCISALYKEDERSVVKECDFSVALPKFHISQISATDFVVYHPYESRTRVDCPNREPKSFNIVGSHLFRLEPNCRGIHEKYSFVAEKDFGVNITIARSNMTIALQDLLQFEENDFPKEEFDRLMAGNDHPISIRQLKKEFNFHRLQLPKFPSFFSFEGLKSAARSVLLVIIILFLIMIAIKCGVCGWFCRRGQGQKPGGGLSLNVFPPQAASSSSTPPSDPPASNPAHAEEGEQKDPSRQRLWDKL